MGLTCILCKCSKERRNYEGPLFSLPDPEKHPKKSAAWRRALDFSDAYIWRKGAKLCGNHFHPRDIYKLAAFKPDSKLKRWKLKENAVPVLGLPPRAFVWTNPIKHATLPLNHELTATATLTCAAVNCSNSSDNPPQDYRRAFFGFPKETLWCDKWIRNIHRTDLEMKFGAALDVYQVCEDHFEAAAFENPTDKQRFEENKTLRGDAVPTIVDSSNLPDPPTSPVRHSREVTVRNDGPFDDHSYSQNSLAGPSTGQENSSVGRTTSRDHSCYTEQLTSKKVIVSSSIVKDGSSVKINVVNAAENASETGNTVEESTSLKDSSSIEQSASRKDESSTVECESETGNNGAESNQSEIQDGLHKKRIDVVRPEKDNGEATGERPQSSRPDNFRKPVRYFYDCRGRRILTGEETVKPMTSADIAKKKVKKAKPVRNSKTVNIGDLRSQSDLSVLEVMEEHSYSFNEELSRPSTPESDGIDTDFGPEMSYPVPSCSAPREKLKPNEKTTQTSSFFKRSFETQTYGLVQPKTHATQTSKRFKDYSEKKDLRIKELQKNLERMKRAKEKAEKKLNAKSKFCPKEAIRQVSNCLEGDALQFVTCLIENSKVTAPQKRRYNDETKALCKTIHCQSPKAYQQLRTLFTTLPNPMYLMQPPKEPRQQKIFDESKFDDVFSMLMKDGNTNSSEGLEDGMDSPGSMEIDYEDELGSDFDQDEEIVQSLRLPEYAGSNGAKSYTIRLVPVHRT